MMRVAFKEWAVICRALAAGRQSLILRKGGIAENGGEFRPEHDAFLLYPTYFHEQQRTGIKPDYLPLLDEAEGNRPPTGTIRFTHCVHVASVHRVAELERILALDSLHSWTADLVRQRFHYRTPGLYVLVVRAYVLSQPVDRIERPDYAGCKTWVELDEPISVDGPVPVLSDDAFAEYVRSVTLLLHTASP